MSYQAISSKWGSSDVFQSFSHGATSAGYCPSSRSGRDSDASSHRGKSFMMSKSATPAKALFVTLSISPVKAAIGAHANAPPNSRVPASPSTPRSSGTTAYRLLNGRLPRTGTAFVHEGHWLWTPHIASLEPIDAEAAALDHDADGSIEVAAATNASPCRRQSILPIAHALIRGESVLDERQATASSQHATHLGQGDI